MSSTSLKREILGIALLLFAVFLGGAFVVLALALAQLRDVITVKQSVGALGDLLALPLVRAFGWPAAVLIPFVPAVHALRLFGRLESRTDRSWMIFFAGMVLLLPVALALALPAPPLGVASAGAGWWGGLVGDWWRSWFGTFGAWVFVALAASVLTAATLSWNPIRAIVGPSPRTGVSAAAVSALAQPTPAKRRKARSRAR